MKKLVILIVMVLLISSCSHKSGGESSDPGVGAQGSEMDNISMDQLLEEEAPREEGQKAVDDVVNQEVIPESGPVEISQAGIYRVKKGDTLMLIAFSIYGDYAKWKDLRELNEDVLGSKAVLKAGMQLKYERPTTLFEWKPFGNAYLIARGDTLGSISKTVYKASNRWKDIWENNKPLIKDPNLIFAGFTLYYVPLAGNNADF